MRQTERRVPASRELRILFLEDQPIDVELALEELRRHGIQCGAKVVVDERDFLAGLRDFSPDLILVDHTLPSYDGLSALAAARKARPETPFIFVSGTLGEEVAIEALVRGATDYVLKQRLERLGPSVLRALREVEERAQRLRTEETLRKNERRLRLALEASKAGTWSWDVASNVSTWDERYQAMYGFRPEDPPGFEVWMARVHPEDQRRLRAHISALLEPGADDIWSEEFRANHPVKGERWMEGLGRVERDSSGHAVRFAGINLDITERKRAEARLREYEKAVEGLQEMIAVVSRDYRYLIANQAFLSARGMGKGQVVGHTVAEVLGQEPFEKEVKHRLEQCFQGKIVQYEFSHTYPRLGKRNLFISYLPIEGPAGIDRAACVLRDITDQKRLQEEREINVRLLGLLNSSHDLRELVRQVTALLHEWLGCDAVGIRLREGDDFPYFETRGFPAEFVRVENQLCVRTAQGEPVRDAEGNPVLQCMCGNVLCSRFDPAKPFFTARGSFWTNCTTQLLATTTAADRQAPTRDRCNGQGYESVALMALRVGQTTYGLLQINDKRKDQFTPERIALVERLADSLAVAIAHRQDQQRLQESERRQRAILDNIPDPVWMKDAQGRFVMVNHAWCELMGRQSEAALGSTNTDVFPPDVAARFGAGDRAVIASGKPTHREHPLADARGRTRWFETLKGPLPGTDGQIVGTVGIARDITERKRAEEALRRLYAYNRSLIEASLDPLVTIGPDGRITDVNTATEQVTGCSRTELIGTDFCDYFTEPDRARAGYQQVFREGLVRDYELGLRHRDGHVTSVLYHASVYRNEAGEILGVFAAARDITRRKQAEEKLGRSRERLRALAARVQAAREEERTRIARQIHDELGQALTVLKMDLRWVENKLSSIPAALAGAMVDRVVEAGNYVDSITAAVQELALELRPGALDNLGLGTAIALEARRFQQRFAIACEFSLPAALAAVPAAVATAVFRVMQEALTNVARHARASKVILTLETRDQSILLTVNDNGVGIDEEKTDAPASLGLFGMNERAKQLGGEFNIRRGSPRGTIATLRIPLPH